MIKYKIMKGALREIPSVRLFILWELIRAKKEADKWPISKIICKTAEL